MASALKEFEKYPIKPAARLTVRFALQPVVATYPTVLWRGIPGSMKRYLSVFCLALSCD